MSLDQAIYDACLADATVSALVGTRVFPQFIPIGQTGAAVTFNIVDGEDVETTDGPAGLPDVRVQITAWSAQWGNEGTREQCDSLFAALVSVWKKYRGTVGGIKIQGTHIVSRTDIDGHNEDNEERSRWGRALDVIISYED